MGGGSLNGMGTVHMSLTPYQTGTPRQVSENRILDGVDAILSRYPALLAVLACHPAVGMAGHHFLSASSFSFRFHSPGSNLQSEARELPSSSQ